MPTACPRKKVNAGLADGSITQAAIDDSVHRILRTVIHAGLRMAQIAKPDHSKVNSLEDANLPMKLRPRASFC